MIQELRLALVTDWPTQVSSQNYRPHSEHRHLPVGHPELTRRWVGHPEHRLRQPVHRESMSHLVDRLEHRLPVRWEMGLRELVLIRRRLHLRAVHRGCPELNQTASHSENLPLRQLR